MHAPLINPRDPLHDTEAATRAAMQRIGSALGRDFSADQVINAAMNLIVNALRQTHADRDSAMRSLDGYVERTRNVLAEQYTGAGRKKGVFAYDQFIVMPLADLRERK